MADLIELFHSRRAVVGVIGLGYVGLPLCATIAEAGFASVGFDTRQDKIESLRRAESYIRHVPSSRLAQIVRESFAAGTPGFFPSADYADLGALRRHPDLRADAADREPRARSVVRRRHRRNRRAAHLRAGQLVVLESTTYPGTTDEVVPPDSRARRSMRAGATFTSPSRPSARIRTTPASPRGPFPSWSAASRRTAARSRRRCTAPSSSASSRSRSASVAEAAKLLENIYRSVNIALVNELKVLFDRMGLNVWEVIDAAATKPFGFTPFYPGPGLGGHCIPIDPFYLTWRARQFELTTRFIELAGEVNLAMPAYVVERLADALNERGKSLKGAQILVLGVAYKRDLDDDRESPAFKLMELLERKHAQFELP